jgi:hypothetical protein
MCATAGGTGVGGVGAGKGSLDARDRRDDELNWHTRGLWWLAKHIFWQKKPSSQPLVEVDGVGGHLASDLVEQPGVDDEARGASVACAAGSRGEGGALERGGGGQASHGCVVS